MKTTTAKTVKTAKPSKTVRKSTLNKKQLHAIYAPAAKIAWITIFANRAKTAKNPTEKKAFLAKMKDQIKSLPVGARARFRELENERAA